MALTSEEKYILLAILLIVMTVVIFYELRVMRGKAKEVRIAGQRKDEAYNAILTTRSVIDVVERDGTDVGTARTVLNRARDAMARGDFDKATDLCESARIELMKCRAQPPQVKSKAAADTEQDDLELLAQEIVSSDKRPAHADSYKGTKLPVNESSGHLSARFELTAAKDEIGKAAKRGMDVSEAKSLVEQAESEFEASNYSRALSLAVKARKQLNEAGLPDTIPLKVAPKPSLAGEVAEDIAFMSESEVSALKCNSCNSMILPDDTFCGQCGAPASKERTCEKCGKVSDAKDRFCRKCGAQL